MRLHAQFFLRSSYASADFLRVVGDDLGEAKPTEGTFRGGGQV